MVSFPGMGVLFGAGTIGLRLLRKVPMEAYTGHPGQNIQGYVPDMFAVVFFHNMSLAHPHTCATKFCASKYQKYLRIFHLSPRIFSGI